MNVASKMNNFIWIAIILKNLLNVKEVTIVKNIKFITGKEIESQVQKRFVLAITMMKSTLRMINNVEVRIRKALKLRIEYDYQGR